MADDVPFIADNGYVLNRSQMERVDRVSTRAGISMACWVAADSLEPPTTDVDLIARLSERNGDVAAAFSRAHSDLEGVVMDLAGTCLAWLEQAEARRVERRRSAA